MRRILIAGYYGFGNAGDEAVLGGMLHDLRGRDPNVEFVVVSGETSATREQHGVQAVAWTDVAGLVTAARSSDLLILGGGGLFHDYWDVRPEDILAPRFCGLASYAGIPLLARLLDRPCMLYGVGVGPLNSEAGKTLTRSAFEGAQLATVRDRASIEALKATGLANDLIDERVFLTADPAFGLPADTAEAARLWLGNEGVPQGEPLMGVCLRPWDFGADQEHWVQQIARALDRWLAEWGGRALLLPFQSRLMSRYEDDVAIARSIVGQMMGTARCTIVGSPLSPALTAAVLGQCSVVLAMRLHAVAFALRSGVPVVAMAYDPKVASLMKDAGLEQLTLQRGEWLAPSLVHRLDLARQVTLPGRSRAFAQEAARLAGASAERALSLIGKNPVSEREPSTADDLAQEVIERAFEVVALREKVEAVRDQRDEVLRERNQFELQLEDMRSTLGVRLLSFYWRTMGRLFPEGGKTREVFHLLRGMLRHGWRSPWLSPRGSTVTVSTPEKGNGTHGSHDAESDPRSDLARFDERVTESGAGRVVAIFSTTRLDENEGQRSTWLALELARRGVPVVFVYWRWPGEAIAGQSQLARGILQLPLDSVVRHPESLCRSFAGLERVALVEFPCPDLARILATANAAGWITGYDVVDDWREFHRVHQARWYEVDFEAHLMLTADFVTAVNERLAARVRDVGRKMVTIIPNGVDPRIACVDEERPLERGDITIGYFGYLSGAWFDWELVAAVGRRLPASRTYLIGYGGGPGRVSLPPNVTLLGRQPHTALAAYAAQWDVAVVPFKTGALAAGADPIKVYEYLALGLPVVVSGVEPPRGAENLVARADNTDEFVTRLQSVSADCDSRKDARRRFAAAATWSVRTDSLLSIVDLGLDRVAEKRWLARPLPQP